MKGKEQPANLIILLEGQGTGRPALLFEGQERKKQGVPGRKKERKKGKGKAREGK